MIPRQQEFAHDPANGIVGDCVRACIASILEMEMKDVPHFLATEDWLKSSAEWLKTHDLIMMTIPAQTWDFKAWLAAAKVPGNVYYIIEDQSPRFPDELHAVVGCNGEQVYDPHPENQLNIPMPITKKRAFTFFVKACTFGEEIRNGKES